MPKKPTNSRLDKLFEGIDGEVTDPPKKKDGKVTGRLTDKKGATRTQKTQLRQSTRTSPLSQSSALPPVEPIAIAQRGSANTPANMSLAFQMDSRSWATLQVVDETSTHDWNQNEQMLVKQVTDQLSQALEHARLFQETRSRAEELAILNEMGRELTTLLDVKKIAATIYK